MLILGPSNEAPIRTNVPLNGFRFSRGDVAQLGERLVRNEKVSGSIPLISTNFSLVGFKSLSGWGERPLNPFFVFGEVAERSKASPRRGQASKGHP